MSIEITDEMVRRYIAGQDAADLGGIEDGLAAVLAMPEVREAIYADVRRENEAKLKALGVTGYSVEGF